MESRARTYPLLAACLGMMAVVPCAAQFTAQSVEAVRSQAPTVKAAPLQGQSTMLDAITEKGERILVLKGTRKAGTRAAIHIHPHAGHTCVVSGSITALMQGRPPLAVAAGKCFYMPPNVPMAAANLGTEDAVVIDTFILPPGHPEMTLLEDYP